MQNPTESVSLPLPSLPPVITNKNNYNNNKTNQAAATLRPPLISSFTISASRTATRERLSNWSAGTGSSKMNKGERQTVSPRAPWASWAWNQS